MRTPRRAGSLQGLRGPAAALSTAFRFPVRAAARLQRRADQDVSRGRGRPGLKHPLFHYGKRTIRQRKGEQATNLALRGSFASSEGEGSPSSSEGP